MGEGGDRGGNISNDHNMVPVFFNIMLEFIAIYLLHYMYLNNLYLVEQSINK